MEGGLGEDIAAVEDDHRAVGHVSGSDTRTAIIGSVVGGALQISLRLAGSHGHYIASVEDEGSAVLCGDPPMAADWDRA